MKKINIKLWCLVAVGSLLYTTSAFAGSWEQENGGWKYNENGSYISNSWFSDQNTWYHFDQNGMMQKGWLMDQNGWYYLDQSGAMLTDTNRTIDGTNYSFDSTGKWIEPVIPGNQNNFTYTNNAFNYSISFPQGYNLLTNEVSGTMEDNISTHFFVMNSNGSSIAAFSIYLGFKADLSYFPTAFRAANSNYNITEGGKISFGGKNYHQLHISDTDSSLTNSKRDVYYTLDGNDFFYLITDYIDSEKAEITQILNSMKPLK